MSAVIGVELDPDTLVLTRRRDFKWSFSHLDADKNPVAFPDGELYFELQTGGETNALQEVKVLAASGGTYAFTFKGETTGPIDYYDATSNPHGIDVDVTDALEALSNVGAGNVFVHPAQLFPVWEIHLTLNAGNNEFQKILVSATAGTFTLGFAGYTTAALAYNASASTVQTALQGLTSVGTGNVAVTAITGGYRVEFKGALSGTDVQQIIANGDALTGTISVDTTSQGSGALTEPIVNLINKTANDFFNTFDTLLGVDVDLEVHDNLNATLKVSSLKSFEEVGLITFAVDVTSTAIETYFNTVAELFGLFDTISIDFYWNHVYQVEFINDLGLQPQPALIPDTTLLTGLNDEQTVTVGVLQEGKTPLTKWNFTITDSQADLQVESEDADLVQHRTPWQLVFLPTGEVAGGDPVSRGRVLVQE